VVFGVVLILGLLSLLAFAYCLLEVATTPAADVRGLPKPVWFGVLLVPIAGPVAWYFAGRPQSASDQPRRTVLPEAPPQATSPDDDEDFLRELRRRAEQQRRRADEQRRRAEQQRGDEDRPA
jgi:hypothetical protein